MGQASPKAGSETGEPTKSADSDSSSGDVEGYRSRSTPEGGLERAGSGHQMGTSASSSQPCPLEATRMVLKKPFFRNWDDFINFDLSLKHKMAITLSEFDLLMQKRDDPVTGWDLCVNKKDMKGRETATGGSWRDHSESLGHHSRRRCSCGLLSFLRHGQATHVGQGIQ